MYRKFYTHSHPDILLNVYISLVRPRLEYSCAVWDPHYKEKH